MNDGSMKSGFPGAGSGWPVGGIFDAMDQLRGMFEQKVAAPRMARGDVRAAVLALLAEQPMHGYQIIQQIDERSGGSWKPSPGSVYPTLQLLADQGLVVASESDGRKTYSLTGDGREAAEMDAEKAAPWESSGARAMSRGAALPKAGFELAQAVAQLGRTGSAAQVTEAVAVLEEARRKVYGILAQKE